MAKILLVSNCNSDYFCFILELVVSENRGPILFVGSDFAAHIFMSVNKKHTLVNFLLNCIYIGE